MAYTKQAKKHTGRGQKEQIVAELVEKLDDSNGLVFADYQGLTHKQLEDLKRELKKLNSTMVVAKNSLLKLSLGKSKNFADLKDNEGLNLPTAALFIQGDMVESLKQLQKTIKNFSLPKIKFGILEGNLTDEAGVLKIASLPNRETLLTQLAGTLNSPIQGLVVALNANIAKFVMTLNAIAQSKPAEAAAPAQTPIAEQASNEPVIEPAVPASQPAVQAEAPVETDESADAGTEVIEPTVNEPATEETKTEEQKEEVKKQINY